jgi:hypothetical protein
MANILVTHDELIKLGFEHRPTLLLNDYSLNIAYFPSEFKTLSVMLDPGNIYVHLRCGNLSDNRADDAIICLFNQDIHGVLTKSWLEDMKHLLNWSS